MSQADGGFNYTADSLDEGAASSSDNVTLFFLTID
jgi:hypothetical protein